MGNERLLSYLSQLIPPCIHRTSGSDSK